ncbi:MAG: twin-arginine translocase subunit TatC [archaeon]
MRNLLIANAIALVLALCIGLFFSMDLAKFLVSLVGSVEVVSINPVNSFMALMETGVLAGLLLYAPLAVISFMSYAWGALYKEEKEFAIKSSIFGLFLFLAGIIVGAVTYTKFVVPYFVELNKAIGITSLWDYGNLLTTILTVSFGTGLIFLFPIPLRYVIKKGWINRDKLAKQRPMVAVAIFAFVIFCPFTPMDVIGQTILFLPLYLLFEISIFDGFGLWKRKKPVEEEKKD